MRAARAARRPAARASARCTSSARTASRRDRADRGAARARGRARRRYISPHVARLARADLRDGDAAGSRAGARARARRRAERSARPSSRRSPPPRSPSSPPRGVEAAAVEAGLGGRYDATNVIDARGRRADERGARAHRACSARRARRSPPRSSRSPSPARPSCSATPSASALVAGRTRARRAARLRGRGGVPRPPGRGARGEAALPGRLERRGGELWDGAHNPEAVDWLLERLPGAARLRRRRLDPRRQGRRRDARAAGAGAGGRSSRPAPRTRAALPAGELAARARTWFQTVETVDDPREALRLARSLGPTGPRHRLALPACRPDR